MNEFMWFPSKNSAPIIHQRIRLKSEELEQLTPAYIQHSWVMSDECWVMSALITQHSALITHDLRGHPHFVRHSRFRRFNVRNYSSTQQTKLRQTSQYTMTCMCRIKNAGLGPLRKTPWKSWTERRAAWSVFFTRRPVKKKDHNSSMRGRHA